MDLRPPEALHGPTVTLRRHRLDDAPALREAIAFSFETLRQWMPWAQAPPTEESILAFLEPGVERFANIASQGVARSLGVRLDRIEADTPGAPAEIGRSMIWVTAAPV